MVVSIYFPLFQNTFKGDSNESAALLDSQRGVEKSGAAWAPLPGATNNIGILENQMETKGVVGFTLGLYRDYKGYNGVILG